MPQIFPTPVFFLNIFFTFCFFIFIFNVFYLPLDSGAISEGSKLDCAAPFGDTLNSKGVVKF